MTALFNGQFRAFLDGAWGSAATLGREELQDVIDMGLAMLDALRRIDKRASDRMRAGGSLADRSAVEEASRLYENWYAGATETLRAVEEYEARGETIANASEFRAECKTSHFTGFEPEALQRAAQQFSQGHGRPLGEVLDAVRRRTVG